MSDTWQRVSKAVAIIADGLGVSVGAAGAALCRACAEGAVRWRAERVDDNGMPIRTTPGTLGSRTAGVLTREAWGRAHIADGLVIDGRDSYCADVNLADLQFWLRERKVAASGRGESGRPSMMPDIAGELRARANKQPQELERSWHAQSGALARWAKTNPRDGITPPKASSIERDDDLKELYQALLTVTP